MDKILIVDDSATVRKLLVHTLKPKHYHCIEATDGIDALEKLAQHPDVRLVISDLNMPNMDGIQFLTSVRSRPEWSSIPVIMITTEGSQAKVLEAVQLGAQGYVRKPFTAEQIKEKITSCLSELAR